MSASAPAGKITRKTGRVVAACTRPTINGDIVSWVISHPAPTFCIQVPVYEITAATQSERNRGSPNGAHAEPFAVLRRLDGIDVFTASDMVSRQRPFLPLQAVRRATLHDARRAEDRSSHR